MHPKRKSIQQRKIEFKKNYNRLLQYPVWKQSGAILKEKIHEKRIRKEKISKKKKGSKLQEAKRKQVIRETHI